MLIAAALIELSLSDAASLKAKRRVVRSVVSRLRGTFNVAVSEIDDLDDCHSVCLGCVTVGNDARHIRERLAKAIRFVDRLGLGELVSDDVVVVRLDEVEELPDDEDPAPRAWRNE